MVAGSEWTFNVLSRAGVICSTQWRTPRDGEPVFLTRADQIVGPHSALLKFVAAFPEWYKAKKMGGQLVQNTWESHHIVEEQDLDILRSLGRLIPAYENCPAVLLPREAHRNRINRTLGRGNERLLADFDGYRQAYDLLGNYTGAGEKKIRDELTAICRIVLST